ncbi:hypothetical protein G4V62_14835 [Bacillaceae bacterium SIJ1]|uniref:metallophosphoesterase n=1 Tax=Litoribacterium kuwaitense TaxID=1398745 RepID=UPI0013EBA415|nr:metallophosphoesterase [Litoribacterium kuwaitense]NGP46162.1 hypothetical protein [Litoribacterium kuwaitense]
MRYDIIGDVHGCFAEMIALLKKLSYTIDSEGIQGHPSGRMCVFVGDLTDRGPHSLACARFVANSVLHRNTALYVPGNHCDKLYRYLLGRPVQVTHGLETTVAEMAELSSPEQKRFATLFKSLYENAPLSLHLDDEKLVVAHAGWKPSLEKASPKKRRTFILYGDISGETLPNGRPVRRDWAQTYEGKATVVYGHTPVSNPVRKNGTINIDTGAVFGGQLTAYSYPEDHCTSVASSLPYVADRF